MEKINDIVFGEMIYKYSWMKKDKFIFLGKEYEINIIAQAYKGNEILEVQRNNFIQYQEFLNKNSDDIKIKLSFYSIFGFLLNIKLLEKSLNF